MKTMVEVSSHMCCSDHFTVKNPFV